MKLHKSAGVVAWLGVWMIVLVPCAMAQDSQTPTTQTTVGPNVKVTLTVGHVETTSPGSTRSYTLLARAGGSPAKMIMGWRTPIPTTTTPDGDSRPVTSYVYQNVGMTARLEVGLLQDGRILVSGAVEISGTRDDSGAHGAPSDMPVIGTFQQDLSVALRDGVALRVAEVPDPDGGNMYLNLTARRLD